MPGAGAAIAKDADIGRTTRRFNIPPAYARIAAAAGVSPCTFHAALRHSKQVRSPAKLLLSICALTLTAHAAVVEGVILDEESGNPLARTQVSLTPLPGTLADVTVDALSSEASRGTSRASGQS